MDNSLLENRYWKESYHGKLINETGLQLLRRYDHRIQNLQVALLDECMAKEQRREGVNESTLFGEALDGVLIGLVDWLCHQKIYGVSVMGFIMWIGSIKWMCS